MFSKTRKSKLLLSRLYILDELIEQLVLDVDSIFSPNCEIKNIVEKISLDFYEFRLSILDMKKIEYWCLLYHISDFESRIEKIRLVIKNIEDSIK